MTIGEIANQIPSAGSDPLAAAKAEKHRADRADKRRQTDPCDSRGRKPGSASDEHGNCALKRVANKSHHSRTGAARTNDVGRPDIATADGARIEPADAADNHARRN